MKVKVAKEENGSLGSLSKKRLVFRLLLPGVLFFFIGIGNIIIGHQNSIQYARELLSLAQTISRSPVENLPPLAKLELIKNKTSKLYRIQEKAKQRRQFYDLVTFGGKVFLSLSILLFSTLLLMFRSFFLTA